MDQAIQLQPDFADAYVVRGHAKVCLGQNQEAIADYNQALRLQPDNVYAYAGRANAKSGLNQYQDAFADLDYAHPIAA